MRITKILGVAFLALVWFWLCRALLLSAGGFTAKNAFLIVVSGIIVFVPLWKKYFRQNQQ